MRQDKRSVRDVQRDRSAGRDRESGPEDQKAADLDQIASALDQSSADLDHAASDENETQSAADQRLSDRDQAASDSEHAARGDSGSDDELYETARAERARTTVQRATIARERAQTNAERLEQAARRDHSAHLRDLSAEARDRTALQLDLAEALLEDERKDLSAAEADALAHAASARARAHTERVRAAADRASAAADRAAAAYDREQAEIELHRAQLDHLTGALGRSLGLASLEREMNRARHHNGRLVLAVVDVDRLKRVNDSQGHAAGDALLCSVVAAIQAHLRSYDPVVRVGGDEFVCALGDCTYDEAARRFTQIQAAIGERHPGQTISIGFAMLRPEDTLDQLVRRGDAALYEARRSSGVWA